LTEKEELERKLEELEELCSPIITKMCGEVGDTGDIASSIIEKIDREDSQ
jgi:hypothetical protein